MDTADCTILAVNVALGSACAWPLAGLFVSKGDGSAGRLRRFGVLIGIYCVEAAAFSASMGTDLLSVALAVVWGLLLPRRLRRLGAPLDKQRKVVLLFAGYTSLPAASLLSVPIATALGGWPILSPSAAARFGIPGFLPPPLDTILGFCSAVALVAVLLKVSITTGLAYRVIRRARPEGPPGPGEHGERDT
jgi:hypothetical protein